MSPYYEITFMLQVPVSFFFLMLNVYSTVKFNTSNKITEIFIHSQLMTLYHIGVGYFCFDNLLCVMNLHLATQFQILQYKMSRMTDLTNKGKGETNLQFFSASSANKCYTVFKMYVQQHQALIAYCGKLESVFNLPVLAQVLAFSLVMCLDGYQILMVSVTHSYQLYIFRFLHLKKCHEPCMRKVQKCTEYILCIQEYTK